VSRSSLRAVLTLVAVLALPVCHVAAQGSAPLRPGDGVRITIFEDSAFAGEFLVDDRGMLVLPRIGDWPATGMPADSVRPRLMAALRASLLSPGISVVPFRRVPMVGAVLRPGFYPVDPAMTVSEVLILAGGPREDARPIVQRRATDGRVSTVSADATVWALALGATEQLVVPREGWLRRNWLTMTSLTMQVVILVLQLSQ